MDYSVIIPAHNSEQYIERCLEHVLSSDLGREFEVIVVDDDSGDLTVEKAKKFGVIMVRNKENGGPAFSRNQGAKIARGDVLVFVDSDMMIYPDTLKKIAHFLKEKNGFMGVSGNYEPHCPMKNFLSCFKNVFACYARMNQPENVDWAQSSLFAIKADAFKSVGGFNEQLRHCEDVMLGRALVRHGYKIAFCRTLGAKHMKVYSLSSFIKERIARSRTRIVIRLSGKARNMASSKDSISSRSIQAMYLFLFLPPALVLGQINILYALIPVILFYAVSLEFLSLCRTTFGNLFFIRSSFMILLDYSICWAGIFLGCNDYLKGRRI